MLSNLSLKLADVWAALETCGTDSVALGIVGTTALWPGAVMTLRGFDALIQSEIHQHHSAIRLEIKTSCPAVDENEPITW